MEHRWDERLSTEVRTVLEKTGGQPVSAVIRNISTGGLYVETAQPLHSYECFEVCVQLPEAGAWHAHRAPAVVTHTETRGAGLMFSAIDRKMLFALKNLTAGRVQESLKFD